MADIYGDMLKDTVDIHLSPILKIISLPFENGCFPDNLKLAEVTPIFKKNNDLDKENCSPVCILFNMPKGFKKNNLQPNLCFHVR